MTEQLGFFDVLDRPSAPAPAPVARAMAAAPAPLAAPNQRTKRGLPAYIEDDEDPAEIAAEFARLHSVTTQDKQVVEVDPKRLDRGGDIDRSYSAQSLMERSAVTAPFRLNGAEWVNCGGLWWRGERWCDCYRLVAVEAFDGPSTPYSEHPWNEKRGSELGGYHGMRATHGNRQVVMVGPPIVAVAGQPEQGALL